MHIEPQDLAQVKRLLAFYAEGYPVYAFGSRMHGHLLKKRSDLDLCIKGTAPMPIIQLARLEEAFNISSLPMRVDVLDWHSISEDFRTIIAKHLTPVQSGAERLVTAQTLVHA